MSFLLKPPWLCLTSGALAIVALLHIITTWWQCVRRGIAARQRHISAPTCGFPDSHASVLIPAWNEASTLIDCLRSLRQVQYPSWEVIIVAGGDDGTYDAAERLAGLFPELALIRQNEGGKNVALNQGLAVATGKVIVILDADSVVTPGWLSALVGPISAGAAASCGNYLPLRYTWVSRIEQMEKTSAYMVRGLCILQGSGSIAVRREALLDVGGFPEDVTVGVDWDLDVRLTKTGASKGFAEDALVWTHRPATLAEYWQNEVRWRRAHMASLWRHRDRFLGGGRNLLNGTLFYIVAGVYGLGSLCVIGCLVLGANDLAAWLGTLGVLFMVWTAGRRAALAGETAGYTADHRWLWYGWAPGVLLLVSIAASWCALITLTRLSPHFKGPRVRDHSDLPFSKDS